MLTGTSPFARKGKTELACKVVLEDERPPKPRDSEKLGLTDKVWESLEKCWGKEPSARPSVDAVSTCLKQAAETWVVDVPAFMLACKAGTEQVMYLEDQAKGFADRLDEVRSCEIRLDRSSDLNFSVPETRQDRYRSRLGEDILEVSPEAMWRIRYFTGLVHAHGGVRYCRRATVYERWVCGRVQGDVQGAASGNECSQDHVC